MQLTRAADYAVRVMIQLAAPHADAGFAAPARPVTDAPESFLSKVLQSLARAGLIYVAARAGGRFSASRCAATRHRCVK